jgi:hypothetical protein
VAAEIALDIAGQERRLADEEVSSLRRIDESCSWTRVTGVDHRSAHRAHPKRVRVQAGSAAPQSP